MRIVLVSPYAWTTPGGVGNHVEHLGARLRARGHEVRVLAPADGPVPNEVVSVGRSVPLPYNGAVARIAFGPRVAVRVRRALRAIAPDIVHVHEPFAPSASLLAAQAARAPCVATFHADAPQSRAYRAARPILSPLWRKLAARIAVSEAARATVERVFGDGVRVIPNGVDTARFAGVPPVDPSSRTVVFVGRLEKRKGARVLAEAFPRLRAAVPDARLVVVGEGPERAACEAAVPASERAAVEFLGRVEPARLPDVIARAGVVCAPSLGGESFGIVLLEAMAAGRPVVASRILGYAAVVRDGAEGILVPPGDPAALAEAMARLLQDPEARRRMGEQGKERARRFDWEVVASEVEGVYEEVLASGAGVS